MRERRPASLLSFAIAASVAVVPIMLGMVLLVAVVRPAQSPAHAQAERYLSVRHVAALKTFEDAVVRRDTLHDRAPTAQDVLAGLPSCRKEWTGGWHAVGPSGAERIASQLAGLDDALRRFSTRDNARVEQPVGLDASRWFAAARAVLDRAIDVPEYPQQPFRMGCADLAAALHALSRADARMLEAVAWRGTQVGRVVARWRPEQVMEIAPHEVARRNPWTGVAGCVVLAASDGTAPVAALGSPRVCALPAMGGASTLAADYARWSVPPSLQAMLEPLESLRQPGGALYRAYTAQHGPNRVMLDGNAVDAGFSIALTIDPALQALAQKTAACYTGQQDVCRALGIHRAQDGDQTIGHLLLEGAMVRMAAIAVIDVASGRIEALAGALSPCTRQEFDGPGRDARCDKRLPYPVQYRPDALLNPAVYHDAMPASTIKPIMAAAFLTDRDVGALWLATEQRTMKPGTPPSPDSLRGQLMRSDSARFLDRMFCSEKNYADCGRPWTVQAMAKAFGWNAGCTDARADCGKQDLLFGRALDGAEAHAALRQAQGEREGIPGSTAVAFGRLMSEPVTVRGTAMHLFPRIPLRSDIVGRCALGADGRRRSEDDWTKCRGGAVVDVVAEGWGQGHARSSALGVAGMMATLAAAANGQAELHRPHLVEGVRGTDRTRLDPAALQWGVPDAQPNAVPHPAAEVILDALSYSHRYGTARTACEEVFDPRSCKGITWIAGKTGTPSFPNDGIGLDEIARACAAGANAQRDSKATCSSLRPYKWYVAAYRSEPGSPLWGKAIGVLTERNWLVRNGQVHGAGDHGPNPSAEIALQIVGRQLGVIQASAP